MEVWIQDDPKPGTLGCGWIQGPDASGERRSGWTAWGSGGTEMSLGSAIPQMLSLSLLLSPFFSARPICPISPQHLALHLYVSSIFCGPQLYLSLSVSLSTSLCLSPVLPPPVSLFCSSPLVPFHLSLPLFSCSLTLHPSPAIFPCALPLHLAPLCPHPSIFVNFSPPSLCVSTAVSLWSPLHYSGSLPISGSVFSVHLSSHLSLHISVPLSPTPYSLSLQLFPFISVSLHFYLWFPPSLSLPITFSPFLHLPVSLTTPHLSCLCLSLAACVFPHLPLLSHPCFWWSPSPLPSVSFPDSCQTSSPFVWLHLSPCLFAPHLRPSIVSPASLHPSQHPPTSSPSLQLPGPPPAPAPPSPLRKG